MAKKMAISTVNWFYGILVQENTYIYFFFFLLFFAEFELLMFHNTIVKKKVKIFDFF